jgi:hypothetical protein
VSENSGPPVARVEAVPCLHRGCVDVRSGRFPEDVLHLTAREWLDFLTAAKAGAFDHVAAPDI